MTFKISTWQGGDIFSTRELGFAMIAEGYTGPECDAMHDLVLALQTALHREL